MSRGFRYLLLKFIFFYVNYSKIVYTKHLSHANSTMQNIQTYAKREPFFIRGGFGGSNFYQKPSVRSPNLTTGDKLLLLCPLHFLRISRYLEFIPLKFRVV